MTRAPLRHVPLSGDMVQLTFTPDEGKVVSALVSGAYLRAKCWGILADIDPGGLVDAALGQRLPFDPAEKGAFSVSEQIVMVLAHGPKTAKGIRAALKGVHAAGDISTRCSQLAARGLIERLDGVTGRGFRATWKLTEAGAAKAKHLGGSVE